MRSVIGRVDLAARAASPGRRHVLVVDDSDEILGVLREVLEDEGYRVTTRAEPVDVDEVAAVAPDVVVLDVLFGAEQRGLDLLRLLRGAPETAEIPVVLCSAAVEPIRRIDGGLLGESTGLVLKPFDVEGLLREVERVLSASDGNGFERRERW